MNVFIFYHKNYAVIPVNTFMPNPNENYCAIERAFDKNRENLVVYLLKTLKQTLKICMYIFYITDI